MFLRAIKRHKDGKLHLYWTLVENVRVWGRVFQRRALYLGELNDSQRAEWQRAIEAFDEKGRARQLKLFPADRAPAEDGGGDIVKVQMDKLSVKNLRNWGEVWLGLELWKRLGLDEFWAPRLSPGLTPHQILGGPYGRTFSCISPTRPLPRTIPKTHGTGSHSATCFPQPAAIRTAGRRTGAWTTTTIPPANQRQPTNGAKASRTKPRQTTNRGQAKHRLWAMRPFS